LLPLAPIEIADSGVNAPWYALAATFFALLWRPRTWAGMTAAGLVACCATSSEILAVIYLPLVLIRLIALPRLRDHAVTAGWSAGLLLQVPVVLATYAEHTQRLGRLATPGAAVGFFFRNVALRALGWRLSAHLVRVAGDNGATVIVCAVLAVLVGWALAQGGQVRAFAVTALATGFITAVFAATVVPYVTHQPVRYGTISFEGGSRYATVPVVLLDAIAVAAADASLRRGRTRRAARRALAAVLAMACVLAIGWATDFRYRTERTTNGYWVATARGWLDACARSQDGEISVPAWQVGHILVACSRLRR
jgi:hypothetical protein